LVHQADQATFERIIELAKEIYEEAFVLPHTETEQALSLEDFE